MNGFPRDKEERLLELLEQELGLFDEIREQTIKQAGLLEADDTEGFSRSLDDRQEIIEKINGLHQEHDVLMQSYVSFSASPDGEKIETIESASGRLDAVIRECIGLNEKNTDAAKGKAEEYIKQIGEMSHRRKSLGKYAQSVPNNPELFDKMT